MIQSALGVTRFFGPGVRGPGRGPNSGIVSVLLLEAMILSTGNNI